MHFSFLLNFHDDLLDKTGFILRCFDSLSIKIKRLLVATRTISEWNQVIRVLVEEASKIIGYGNRVQLIWIDGCVKNMFSSWNSIHNNDNVCNILYLSCMIDITSNSKEFSFSRCYIHCMINSFGNNVLISMDI